MKKNPQRVEVQKIEAQMYLVFLLLTQELLNFHLDSRANWKISKRRFFGDFLNSFNWVTQIGPKTTQKNFFENISKMTGATVVQNFGILDGAADLCVEIWPKFFLLI